MTKRNKKMSFEEIIEAMLQDKRVRLSIVKRSHKFFFYFYFSHYTEFQIAPFHEEMFHITQDSDIRTAVVVAFRGSGKSTIFSLSFPLWAILGEQRIKYILILSQTQQKSQMLLQQIKQEMETNDLLKKDLGPFREERNQWNAESLYLPRYNAKITIASVEQSVRGIRHGQHRPQLIICDDLEDLNSVKTKEGRDKIHNWLMGEVIPAGGKDTRLVIVGSLLHQDSLIKRLQKNIEGKRMSGVFRGYPIIDDSGNITWPGKFPNMEAIETEKAKGYSEPAWLRECMLRIVPDEDQIIFPESLQYYDILPNLYGAETYISIDPAGSDKEDSDYTAMLTASVFGKGDDIKIYIHPNLINKQLQLNGIKEHAKLLVDSLGGVYACKVIVEDVAMQKWLIQELKRMGMMVDGFKVGGVDKRTRLKVAASLIEAKKVFFPKNGAGELIQQLIGFGVEKHDDIADAFSMVILRIMEGQKTPRNNGMYGYMRQMHEGGFKDVKPTSSDPDDWRM